MKRVLVYSHDTYGLGNIRRMLAVVEHLVGLNPDMTALVVSGSPMVQAFRLSPRIDYIKIPCLSRGEEGRYAPKYLDLPYDRMMHLRADLILNATLNFEPDLLLVDKKPLGLQNELAPALQVIKRRIKRPKTVLVLREVFDSPQRTKSIWEKNGYHDAIDDFYDRVLVLGQREIFDTAAEYAFPESTRTRLRYCGYLGKRNRVRPPAAVRAELGLTDEKLVVVTVGGGADGAHVLETVRRAFPDATALPGARVLICMGAELGSEARVALESFAAGKAHVSLLDFTNDMMSYMNAADLVVSMAGYNTVTEIMGLDRPGILIPRTEPVQEQWIRATRLEKHGRFMTIHPDQLTPALLARTVALALANPAAVTADSHVDMNALDVVAEEIGGLLAEREEDTWRGVILHPEAADHGPDRGLAVNGHHRSVGVGHG
jgi:predicted glycosyltransferase